MIYNETSINGTKEAFGQNNESALFILLSNLNAESFDFFCNDGGDGIKIRIPNTSKTIHFFINVKIGDNELQYNSDYTRTKKQEYTIKDEEKQILKHSLQGKSSCFFFSMFFIQQTIVSLTQSYNDDNGTREKIDFCLNPLKDVCSNLTIVENVLNFLISEEQKYFFSKKVSEVSQLEDRQDYYYFTLSDIIKINNSDDIVYCIAKTDFSKINKKVNEDSISLIEIVDQKNILSYCNELKMNAYEFNEENNSFEMVIDINKVIDNLPNLSVGSNPNRSKGSGNGSENDSQKSKSIDFQLENFGKSVKEVEISDSVNNEKKLDSRLNCKF